VVRRRDLVRRVGGDWDWDGFIAGERVFWRVGERGGGWEVWRYWGGRASFFLGMGYSAMSGG
jgi:hypothetical protein